MLKTEKSKNDQDFYNSFGAFASSKSADEIVLELKLSRKFRNKDFNINEVPFHSIYESSDRFAQRLFGTRIFKNSQNPLSETKQALLHSS